MYRIGKWIYRYCPVPKAYGKKVSDCLLQLYGIKEHHQRVQLFWEKKYSIHLYVTFFSLIIGLRERIVTQIFLIAMANFVTHYYLHEKLKEAIVLNREKILEGFFEFSSQFTLMINAGLNYRHALEQSIGDHAFSPYLRKALQQISSGVPETAAFDAIPAQCREMVITRYFNCIGQGQRHGNKDLRKDLKRITEENWQEKLKHHRKMGEILKTKLLFPMMIMFVGILGVLLLPVIIQFQFMM
ncbi:MAG: type II secretion system F family protein [Clostridia bacterium]|nr:type II secretion system F family protein [Clostridia bacterium]